MDQAHTESLRFAKALAERLPQGTPLVSVLTQLAEESAEPYRTFYQRSADRLSAPSGPMLYDVMAYAAKNGLFTAELAVFVKDGKDSGALDERMREYATAHAHEGGAPPPKEG